MGRRFFVTRATITHIAAELSCFWHRDEKLVISCIIENNPKVGAWYGFGITFCPDILVRSVQRRHIGTVTPTKPGAPKRGALDHHKM